jgi:glutathione S-transferase
LVLLEINRAVVQSPIVDENLSGGVELFPHIYGSLPVSAVVAVRDL